MKSVKNASVHQLRNSEERLIHFRSLGAMVIDTHPIDDRRSNDRQPSTVTGVISYGGCKTPIPCVVINRSAVGARLKLLNDPGASNLDATNLPVRMALRMADRPSDVLCQVRWRMGAELGCKFLSNYDSKSRTI
jgi:hypothetical protein